MYSVNVKEQNIIISYRTRKDVSKVENRDGFYTETLKNCTNLLEEVLHNNFRIVISLDNPVRLDDIKEDIISFCKRYSFLKDSTNISAIDNVDFTDYNNIANIDFYLKRFRISQ